MSNVIDITPFIYEKNLAEARGEYRSAMLELFHFYFQAHLLKISNISLSSVQSLKDDYNYHYNSSDIKTLKEETNLAISELNYQKELLEKKHKNSSC